MPCIDKKENVAGRNAMAIRHPKEIKQKTGYSGGKNLTLNNYPPSVPIKQQNSRDKKSKHH